MSEQGAFDDILFYAVSSPDWRNTTITSPLEQGESYTVESQRKRRLGSKAVKRTIVSKVDSANSSSEAHLSVLARRTIARIEWNKEQDLERISIGGKEDLLDVVFPKLKWPAGFRNVRVAGEEWTWIGTRGEPTLQDDIGIIIAFWCPNITSPSGNDGHLAIHAYLSPEQVDIVVIGFILAMRDAAKLFGQVGENPSPRPGYGGLTWGTIEQRVSNLTTNNARGTGLAAMPSAMLLPPPSPPAYARTDSAGS